jgi:hypothetical protein
LTIFYADAGFEICETTRYADQAEVTARLKAALDAHQEALDPTPMVSAATPLPFEASRAGSEPVGDACTLWGSKSASTACSTASSDVDTPTDKDCAASDVTAATSQVPSLGEPVLPSVAFLKVKQASPSRSPSPAVRSTYEGEEIDLGDPLDGILPPTPKSASPKRASLPSIPGPAEVQTEPASIVTVEPVSSEVKEGSLAPAPVATEPCAPSQPTGPDYRSLPVLDLAIRATKKFSTNDIIPFLSGSLADLTPEQDDDLREDRNGLQNDFSVMMNPIRRVFQLFLGPARFCNVGLPPQACLG